MKKLFLALGIIFSTAVYSQDSAPQYLEVDYQMEILIDVEEVLSNVPAQYRSYMEESLRQEAADGIFIDYTLKTNGNESEYAMVEKIDNSQNQNSIVASWMGAMDKEATYKNLEEGYYLKPYNFGQAILVKDELQDAHWKISREKENIAGFDTYKATGVVNDSVAVTAWYTPKINIKDGPDRIWGLPGLILKAEFTMNNSDVIISAVKVTVREKEIKIKKPSKGKIMTEQEFMDEMKALQEKYKDIQGAAVDTD